MGYPVTNTESRTEPSSVFQGRREMAAAAALAFAGAVTKDDAAMAQEAATKKKDVRLGLLLVPPAAAVGWVGFNILGPALNQLDGMNEADAARKAAAKTGAKTTKAKKR